MIKIYIFTILILLGGILNATTPTQVSVAKVYVATIDRAPDIEGLKYWVEDSELSLEEIAMSFFDQNETQQKYPKGTSSREFIKSIYANLFKRLPDKDGWDYWERELDNKNIKPSVFILAVTNGALGDDENIINNRTMVSILFALSNNSDIEKASEVIMGITKDINSVYSAIDEFKLDDSSLSSIRKELIGLNANIKAKWIESAFVSLESDKYKQLKAISWWNSNFDDSLLAIDSSVESLKSYQIGVGSDTFIANPQFLSSKLIPSELGIYHAAFPSMGETEDVVTLEKIEEFENLAKKEIAWVYFSNNWFNGIKFPSQEVNIINESGKVPFIRIMPRTNFDVGTPDINYTMQKIIDGDFDVELTQWAIDASRTNINLLVDFGIEINTDWFPWNGQYNGADTTTEYGDANLSDGAERFRDAYRHIIDICNDNGAINITWFFHIYPYDTPDIDWNRMENYYPGDEYIDWLGVSIYGPITEDEIYQEFSEILDDIYPRLTDMSDKPIAILEVGITELE